MVLNIRSNQNSELSLSKGVRKENLGKRKPENATIRKPTAVRKLYKQATRKVHDRVLGRKLMTMVGRDGAMTGRESTTE